MKLITSFIPNSIKPLFESTGTGEKKVYIEGVFMQAEVPNRNNRKYPREILESAVDKYVNEQVKTGRAVGELNHPEGPTINLDKVSHRITELRWDKNDVIGRALVLNTPMGLIVKGLLEGGVQLGVSSRGMGSVEEGRNCSVVCEDFLLNTVDIVQDPSAPSAFVNGIMEGVEFFYDKRQNRFVAEKVEGLKKKFKKMSKAQIVECQVREFNQFLKSIR